MTDAQIETPSPSPDDKLQELTPRGRSRRKFLRKAAIVVTGTAVGAGIIYDVFKGNLEEISQYEVPEKVTKAIDLLEQLDLQLPQDQLYGLTFPSTKEIAQKYQEGLTTKIGDPPIQRLIVKQEKEPQALSRRILRLLGRVKIHEAPEKSTGKSIEEHSFLYLPPYYATEDWINIARTAITLYHEGIHLFYQQPAKTDQELIDNENPANIASLLLMRLLKEKGHDLGELFFFDDINAYERAVTENNKDVWEKELKKLYEVPEDCCTFSPALNSQK